MSGLHENDLDPLSLPVVPGDHRLIGRGGETFRTGAMPQYAFPTYNTSGNDVGSFATLANYVCMAEDIVVDRLYGNWNNATIGNVYSMFIGNIGSTGDLTGTLATALARFTTLATGVQQHAFDLTPVTLVAGVRHIIALVRTDGVGTSQNRALGAQFSSYPNVPLDVGKMCADAFATSAAARTWYAQASDAPGVVSKSGSNTGIYSFGFRFYK